MIMGGRARRLKSRRFEAEFFSEGLVPPGAVGSVMPYAAAISCCSKGSQWVSWKLENWKSRWFCSF